MFPRRLCIVFSLLAAASLSGCAFFRKKAPRAEEARPVRLGRVALVNEADRFALIETFSPGTPNVGTTLRIYRGDAVVAELRATSVRRRPFLVADLVSGAPARGDVVFQPRSETAEPPRAEPAVTASAAPAATPAPRKSFWRRWLFPFGQ